MKSNEQHENGYTLIEVMTTVAIVGTLIMIALPAYSDYKRRSEVSGSLSLLEPSRISIAEEVLTNTSSGAPSNNGPQMGNETWAEVVASAPSPYVRSIVKLDTILVINYTSRLDPEGFIEYSLVMRGRIVNNKMEWTCKTGSAAESDLNYVASRGGSVGMPLPAGWAPPKCTS